MSGKCHEDHLPQFSGATTETFKRATVFLQVSVAILTAQAIATPFASALMTQFGTTVPILVGYGFGMSVCIAALFAPETIHSAESKAFGGDSLTTTDSETGAETPIRPTGSRGGISRTVQGKTTTFHLPTLSPVLVALVAVLLIDAFVSGTAYVVVQYASTKFSVPIAVTGYLITIRAVATVVVFLFLVPVVGARLQERLGLDIPSRDLWLSRIAISCCPVGLFLIAASPNMAPMVIGMIITAVSSGASSLVRSIITGIVEPERVSVLNGVINVVQAVGSLVSGPLLAELFALGLRLGNNWIALPFDVAAASSLVSCAIVWLVSLPDS